MAGASLKPKKEVIPIDTLKILDQLEALVEDSRNYFGFRRFDDEDFYMLVSKLRASLPEDVRRAGKITKDSAKIVEVAQSEADQVVTDAQAQAEQILKEAGAKAQAMVDQSEVARISAAQAREIIAQAEGEARAIRERAEAEARETRHGADEYARDVLATLEEHVGTVLTQVEGRVTGMLSTIQRGRQKLEQRAARPPGPYRAEDRREAVEVTARVNGAGLSSAPNGRL